MNGPSHKAYPYATISHQQTNYDHQIVTKESSFDNIVKKNFYFAKMTSSRGQICHFIKYFRDSLCHQRWAVCINTTLKPMRNRFFEQWQKYFVHYLYYLREENSCKLQSICSLVWPKNILLWTHPPPYGWICGPSSKSLQPWKCIVWCCLVPKL